MPAVAVRAPVAQQEHGQPLVMMAPFADLLTLVEDGPGDALDGPFDGAVVDPRDPAVERRLPRQAKGDRRRARLQFVSRFPAHPDGPARIVDAAAGGESLEERRLARNRPAVVAPRVIRRGKA